MIRGRRGLVVFSGRHEAVVSAKTQKVDELVAHAEKSIDGGIAEAEQQIGRVMTDAQKAAFVGLIVAQVKRQLATPADAIANAVLAKIAAKAAIIAKERVIVLNAARERTARKRLQPG